MIGILVVSLIFELTQVSVFVACEKLSSDSLAMIVDSLVGVGVVGCKIIQCLANEAIHFLNTVNDVKFLLRCWVLVTTLCFPRLLISNNIAPSSLIIDVGRLISSSNKDSFTDDSVNVDIDLSFILFQLTKSTRMKLWSLVPTSWLYETLV